MSTPRSAPGFDSIRLAPISVVNRRHVANLQAVCVGKDRFGTAAQAHHAARRIRKRKGTKLHVYHCRNCDGFHLTSSPRGDLERK